MARDLSQGVTLKDVAAHAQVSLATASRALNGGGYIGAQTKQRVEQAVRDLGYKPHAAARSLKLQRTGMIGLIITDIANPFYAQVAAGVLDSAQRLGYHVILSATDENAALEREYLDVLMETRVDGIVAVPTGHNVRAWQQVRALGIQVVLVDREIADLSGTDVVLVDNVKGAYAGTSHLIAFGHRRIAIMSGPTSTTTGRERLEGYYAALRDAHLPVAQDLVQIGTFKRQSGIEATHALLSLDQPPTAIFASNNVLAESAMFVMRERGLAVSEDISLVMFDDVPWASLTMPALTVVAQPTYRLGVMAVEQLIQLMRQREGTHPAHVKAVLQPELIVRASVAAWPPSVRDAETHRRRLATMTPGDRRGVDE